MTFRAKLKEEHPEKIDERCAGGCIGCPSNYGYEENYDCKGVTCKDCWNREMPNTEQNVVNVGELMDRTYEQGLNDAWELAKKIWCGKDSENEEIFGTKYVYEIYQLTPQEALAKLKAYEEAQSKIEVGDVVTTVNGKCPYIVTNVQLPNTLHVINSRNGYTHQIRIDVCKKTGKHIDISSILEQIGE